MSLAEIQKRTAKIAKDVRRLKAFDGHSSPPDWRPFVAELADEVEKLVAELPKQLADAINEAVRRSR